MFDLSRKHIIIVVLVVMIIVMLFYKYTKSSKLQSIQNFESQDLKPKIINFNTSWCYWSKKLEPVWEILTDDMKGKDIEVLDVKCDLDVNKGICDEYEVKGFPTIKLIVGDTVLDYNGERSLDGLSKFINTNIKY